MQIDFSRIASLHANGVRVIVNAAAFGFPNVSPTMASRLSQTISMAASDGLRVELTLFDGWSAYSDIAESTSWVSKVLAPLRGDPQIAYIDLHNELPTQRQAAIAWAQALVPYVKSIDGGIPVTVSTSISSGTASLQALAEGLAGTPPDLYDVHYYGDAADAYAVLAQAKRIAGSVPLYVGETGFATSPNYGWASGLQPETASLEAFQDYYFRMVENATEELGLPLAAPWILYDMPGEGGTEWGEHMGLLRADGTAKDAAGTLSSIFAGGSLNTSFNNGFELSGGQRSEPYLWRRWLPGEAHFSVDHTVAHSGTASARISAAQGNHLTGCPAYYVAPIAAVQSGVTYAATAWARGSEGAGSSRVVLVWTDSAGRFIGSSESPPLPAGNSGWTFLSVAAVPPPGAEAVEIDLRVCENPGTTWFDDVSFITGS